MITEDDYAKPEVEIPPRWKPHPQEGVRPTSFCIPPSMLDWVNDHYRQRGAAHRSDYIRKLIRADQAKHYNEYPHPHPHNDREDNPEDNHDL